MEKLKLFSNHNDWEVLSEYMSRHKSSGALLWTANGAFFFDGCNGGIHFGLFERHILWCAYKRMLVRKMLGEDK